MGLIIVPTSELHTCIVLTRIAEEGVEHPDEDLRAEEATPGGTAAKSDDLSDLKKELSYYMVSMYMYNYKFQFHNCSTAVLHKREIRGYCIAVHFTEAKREH